MTQTFPPHFAVLQGRHHVTFGEPAGAVLERVLREREHTKFLLIASSRSTQTFEAMVSAEVVGRCAGRFTSAEPHVPAAVARRAADLATTCGADSIVAFGGGTALDTAKAVAHWLGLPIIAIPTSLSGSEVTRNFGLTVDGVKRTIIDEKVLPQAAIYDPALLASLPARTAVCSGVNAIAHAIEALYAVNANPMTCAIATAGIREVIGGLRVWEQGGTAQWRCLAGAWLCGEVLAQVGMGLHHRICHVLGGTYGVAHAQAHTIVLPYVVDFNAAYVPAFSALADLFAEESFGRGLALTARALGAPRSLQELGFDAARIPDAVRLCLASPLHNPRSVGPIDIENILEQAHAGALPA